MALFDVAAFNSAPLSLFRNSNGVWVMQQRKYETLIVLISVVVVVTLKGWKKTQLFCLIMRLQRVFLI